MPSERVLVNFFYAHPVGHAVEALHYDLERIVTAAGELLRGSLTYEQALRDYFTALLTAMDGDAAAIWSIDAVHLEYLSAR